MKLLTVSALVSAMMVLAGAAALPEETPETDQSESLDKRSTCSGGWSPFRGRCFLYFPKPLSWARAEKNCQSLGGNLASIHNVLEYHEIQRLILSASHQQDHTWVGGSDAQQENQWFWSDGTHFNYVGWCPGEPNNYRGRQHCLQVNFGAQKCWDDYYCDTERPSVCVRKL